MGRTTLQRTYAVSGVTGTVGAGLAQDSLVFAMLADPTEKSLWVYFDQLRLALTTIAAFTVPIVAARRLGVYRASGGVAATGGTGLNVVKKQTGAPPSMITSVRIAAAVALTPGAIVREADPILTLDLTAFGAAGARAEAIYEFNPESWNPGNVLEPGELLVISNPVAMDAGGTWQLAATAHWREDNARL